MGADALYAQYGIALAGVIACLGDDSGSDAAEVARFRSRRTRSKTPQDPALGGRYDVFEIRLLSREILAYCAANVLAMPRLFEEYNSRLDGKMDLTEKGDFHACRVIQACWNRFAMAEGPPRPASSKGPWDDYNGG